MNPNEYQKLAARTLISDRQVPEVPAHLQRLLWNTLGLVGEAGELAEIVKKGVYHQHGINSEKFEKEIGDVLWYLAAICTCWGVNLEDIMSQNIEKLKIRYPEGFSVEDSKRRVDTIRDPLSGSTIHLGAGES